MFYMLTANPSQMCFGVGYVVSSRAAEEKGPSGVSAMPLQAGEVREGYSKRVLD